MSEHTAENDAPRGPVTSVEPGCTCGGFAACLQCQERDENDALVREAWDDGYQAGHEDARAVQPTYPDPTPNPYRVTPPERDRS